MLVVSHRPLDARRRRQRPLAAPAARAPEHGWRVVECSPPAGATTEEMSTDPRAARLAARRAQVMAVAGRILDPLRDCCA